MTGARARPRAWARLAEKTVDVNPVQSESGCECQANADPDKPLRGVKNKPATMFPAALYGRNTLFRRFLDI